MDYPGLLNWANSVRLTMTSDPGRQLFKEQVQTHGFLFLDDYLDSIVSGQKQDPLIELVKTPGRKKAASRKPKLMTSKLGNPIPLSFEDSNENENILPAKDLVKSLSKVDGVTKLESPNESRESPQRPALLPIQPSNSEQNNLSVIAEDEEPSDRNGLSTSNAQDRLPKPPLVVPRAVEISETSSRQRSPQHGNDTSQEDKIDSMSSMDTFHSIPLDSPGERIQRTETFPQTIEALAIEDHNELPNAQSLNDKDHVMTDMQEEVVETSQKLIDKPNPTSFPTLPEPMPLRKSMKPPRDPSMNAVLLGAATPGAPVGGKRTSWLMKAREAKALEGLSKKFHPPGMGSGVGSSSSLTSQGTKRKSDSLSLPQVGIRDDERPPKVARTMEGETISSDSKDHSSMRTPGSVGMVATSSMESQSLPPAVVESPQEGVLDRLKKTVEGLGVRVGKTVGKSVGSDTATVLAEARAAAKAKVAERDRKEEELTMALAAPETVEQKSVPREENEKRLSISDLFPVEGRVKEKHKVHEKPFQFMPNIGSAAVNTTTSRTSTSTTPPHSPPLQSHSFTIPSGPVFNKPPPVFVPPIQVATKPIASAITVPDAVSKSSGQSTTALEFSPRPPLSIPKATSIVLLTAHSTLESVQSDAVFDCDDIPAWMPSTQDTEYTTYGSQSQPQNNQILDEDDSWPMDEKLAAGVQWVFGVSKEDSMTWSTLPSQSQRADTGPVTKPSPIKEDVAMKEPPQRTQQIPGTFDVDMEDDRDHAELEELVMSAPKLVGPAGSTITRSQSQMSMASSDSSQSQGGFLGHASKLLSSALGTSKKGKQPEVKKVLQMAAVAAKKQQEEADKKVARLKEMESRRQLAIQRKAEEEKAKALEEERKMKEESERRKREREELTDKRPIKAVGNKKEDENLKKRKIEAEKKQEIKKPSSSVLISKAHLKTALKPSSVANSSYVYGSSSQPVASTSTAPAEASFSTYKEKTVLAQNPVVDDEVSQPSMLVQSQMAARVKAQIDAAKRVEPAVPSENIELPEINSEYSDSEDEDRVRTFDPPEWAQSPELRQALEMQSTINPDDIFGAVRPLKMEEIFKTRTSRFRARTSSANWTGTDRLTVQEEREYARRMGFK
ncbi:hypothetical protein BYT27DRAFT_7189481 [Phlegmacium glaucopus]|nr:hypothetical protein BYT27DRAFT_7189481 [Phlegmacium glaucopus]